MKKFVSVLVALLMLAMIVVGMIGCGGNSGGSSSGNSSGSNSSGNRDRDRNDENDDNGWDVDNDRWDNDANSNDIPEQEQWLSLEELQRRGQWGDFGVFVKRGDMFLSLGGFQRDISHRTAWGGGGTIIDGYRFTGRERAFQMQASDELVFVNMEIHEVNPLQAYFYASDRSWLSPVRLSDVEYLNGENLWIEGELFKHFAWFDFNLESDEMLLTGDWGEEFVLGHWSGTTFQERTVTIDLVYYYVRGFDATPFPLEVPVTHTRTTNGYFILDIPSSLSGIIAVGNTVVRLP